MGNVDWERVAVMVAVLVPSVILHEVSHGAVAYHFGDDTAKRAGRLTLNPLRHVDPFGTVLLPLLLSLSGLGAFGYAKPVPVNFGRLRHPKRDMIWVALAGPGVNVLLAFVAALLLHPAVYLSAQVTPWVGENLSNAIYINVILAVFNMLPVPPLDGGRVLTGLLPSRAAWRFAQLERYGLLILISLLFLVPLAAQSLFDVEFNPLFDAMWPLIQGLYGLILILTGLA